MLSKKNLTDAQQNAITHIFEHDHSLLSVDMGFGKTVVTLTAIAELIDAGVMAKALVFAPLRVCDLTWKKEHAQWEHLSHLSVAVATGDAKERAEEISRNADITVVNFDNLPWFINTYKSCIKDGRWDMLVVDELTKLKEAGGAWFKRLRRYIDEFEFRVGLTGTLVEEGMEHLYTMTMVVDGGRTFGRNKDRFLSEYFYPTDYNRYNWELKPGSMQRMTDAIAPFTFVHEGDDQNLPPLTMDYDYIDLPPDARVVYETLAKEMVVELDQGTAYAVNEAVLAGKLQQVCSGFTYLPDTGEANYIHSAKERRVREHIQGSQSPVMLVYQFRYELDWLRNYYPNARVLGDKATREDTELAAAEWNAGKLDLLIVHPAAAGHGLNFQKGGNRIIFIGPIWSRDQTDQVIARIRRRGCPHEDVWVTVLTAKDTLEDHVIIPRLMGKGERAEDFRRHLQAASSSHGKSV